MSWKRFAGFVALPIVSFGGYFACLVYCPHFTKVYLHTEHGAIEWGTAVAFLIAACVAIRLAWTTRRTTPYPYRILYGLFAVAGLLVALEEVSYGQKLFHWNSPDWFLEHNSKSETNLHNTLGNKPSDFLRLLATIGCPICCAVLPVWMRLRSRTQLTKSVIFHLLPQLELATISAITIVLSIFNKIPSIRGMATWSGHLGELKELYWGVAAACYAVIISRRLKRGQPQQAQGLTVSSLAKSNIRDAA